MIDRMTAEDLLRVCLTEYLEDEGIRIETPQKLTAAEMPWTVCEVEHVISNAWSVLQQLPEGDKAMLERQVRQVEVVRDYRKGEHQAETRAKVPAPRHHIDQMNDVLEWIVWVRPKHRRLVWTVAEFSQDDYERLPWAKVARCAGVKSPDTGNRRNDAQTLRREAKRRYGCAIRGLCRKLNDMQYPRRLPRDDHILSPKKN